MGDMRQIGRTVWRAMHFGVVCNAVADRLRIAIGDFSPRHPKVLEGGTRAGHSLSYS
jgi:hypothetical protein